MLLSGVVPQISVIAGPCAGGAAYSPALTDFIIQVRHAGQMYITGPGVIREVTGEEVTAEQLGGVECHASYSGVVHFVAETGEEAIQITRRLLSFLPANNTELAPRRAADGVVVLDPVLDEVVPLDPRVPYDMHQVIGRIVDDGDFLEVQAQFAPNLLIGFGRVLGQTVGVVANQPAVRAGVLDIDASDKASRFVRFCNAFNIPLVTLVDVPGFPPGVRQEISGIIRHGAKMLFAYAAATVPKITVVVRKAYGGAYLAMCARDLGADKVAAWPSGEIAVMGACCWCRSASASWSATSPTSAAWSSASTSTAASCPSSTTGCGAGGTRRSSSSASAPALKLVSCGVRGLVNFAPVLLHLPSDVTCEDIDITVSLEKVAYHARHAEPRVA